MMYQGAIVATMDWLYPLSGFVVGAIVGLTGMGGGSLMTPLLILLFGVHPLTAVGTDLLYAAVTKTAGTAIHSKKGNVDWGVAGLLAAGSVPATVLTIWVLSRVPKQSPTTATIISMSMGVALIIAAAITPWPALTTRRERVTRARSPWSSVRCSACLCRCAR